MYQKRPFALRTLINLGLPATLAEVFAGHPRRVQILALRRAIQPPRHLLARVDETGCVVQLRRI